MCDFSNPHQKEKTFQVLTPQQKNGSGLDLDKKTHLWRLLQKDFYVGKKPSRF